MKRDNLINAMRSFDGAKNGNAKHLEILSVYNSCTPLPRNVKMLSSYAWCAATVSAAVVKAGLANELPRECSCGKLIELFQQKGMWVEDDAFVPTPGDFIFYDWSDDGVGDCVEGHDHVGMVEAVSNNKITVMEGNKNGAFGRRTISVNARYIRGFAHLKFDDEIVTNPSSDRATELLNDIIDHLSIIVDRLKELGSIV